MQFSEMVTEVFTRLEESSSSPRFWALADIQEALNDGYEEISDASEWYERNFNLTLTAGTVNYDLRSAIASDTILTIKRAKNQQTDRWLCPNDSRTLDYSTRRWETVTGEPEHFVMHGLWWMGFFPHTSAAGGRVQVWHTALPPALVEDADTPGFPDEYQYGIVEYAIGDLLAQERSYEKALIHFQEYLTYERGLTAYVQKRISMDRVASYRG